MIRLDNKVGLVTGGASGIGRVTALHLAAAGAALAIVDIDEDHGQETARLIRDQGGSAFFIQCDVSQADQVRGMVEAVIDKYGHLDCAFNNAGIEGEMARVADIPEPDFDRIMAVNIKGVWLCLTYEIKQMLARGGSIVNTASVAGLVGSHSMGVYGASKHAVVGLTKSAAVEYASKGIRVNAVCPSVINTPMANRAFAKFPKFREGINKMNPSRRLGEPEEVASAVAWLWSDASSFITGVALPIDGGFTAQ